MICSGFCSVTFVASSPIAKAQSVIAGEDAGLVLFEHGSDVRFVFDGNRLVDHAAQNRRLTMGNAGGSSAASSG